MTFEYNAILYYVLGFRYYKDDLCIKFFVIVIWLQTKHNCCFTEFY